MPLLSIYNNLIHGYAMNRQTRFDSHKRSELSDIHNRLRKLNCEQPLYKIEFDDDVQEYTLTVKEQAMSLSAAVMELGSEDMDGALSRSTIKSEDPRSVGVEVLEGSNVKDFDSMEVVVNNLSSKQVNVGRVVESHESPLSAGQYNFTVEIEGNFYAFQFNVTGTNTNRELQTKLADFINKTKVGLRAEVVTDPETGGTGLNLESKKDGISFRFEDTKTPSRGEMGVVRFFGLNNVKSEASRTHATIDGHPVESVDRKFITDNGFVLDFKRETGDRPVTISKVFDDELVYGKVSEFINKYNNLSEFVRSGSETRRASKKLWYEMNALLSKYAERLSENGIELNDDGLGGLHINREKMSEAVSNGSLAKLFGRESDAVGSLLKKLSEVSLNPMNYVDKTIVVYPNTKTHRAYNPYVTSIYSGMMYNNYC